MTNGNENLAFDEESMGYSKAQVNSYIGNLSKAYQAAYEENQELLAQFHGMQTEFKKLEFQCRTQINAQVIAKKMLAVEALARQIIEEKQWIDKVIN